MRHSFISCPAWPGTASRRPRPGLGDAISHSVREVPPARARHQKPTHTRRGPAEGGHVKNQSGKDIVTNPNHSTGTFWGPRARQRIWTAPKQPPHPRTGRKEHCILGRAVDREAAGRVSDTGTTASQHSALRGHKGDPVQRVFSENRQPQVPDKNAGLLHVIMNSVNYSVKATRTHTKHRQIENQHARCRSERSV